MATILHSCGQENNSTTDKVSKELKKYQPFIDAESQTRVDVPGQKNVDTKFVYVDDNGQNLIIENSYPRGGLKYTDPMGKEYVYAVFWTQITNETDNPFELTMEFPENFYDLPSSPSRFFKLFIPSDTMTPEKEPLFNYGLDLEKLLDNNLQKKDALKRTIDPKSFSGFYVVTLFNRGVDGTLRAGLSINEGNLFYRINEKEIHCGRINLKQLKIRE